MKKNFTLVFILFATTYCGIAQTNYGFESWTVVAASPPAPAYDDPNNWKSLNYLTSPAGALTCTKATGSDVHSGSFAVKLTTKSVGGIIANGLLTTGTVYPSTNSVGGGMDYTLRPDSIIGWYKCAPQNGDSGFMEIQLLGAGGDTDTIGYAIFRTPGTAVTTYTRFATKIIYRNEDPIVKSIWILSSSYNNTIHFVNSILILDDLQLGSDAWLATEVEEISGSQIKIGTDPSTGNLIIYNPDFEKTVFKLFDAMGIAVKSQIVNSNEATLNTGSLNNGVYIYSFLDENNINIKSGKIAVQH